jgi:hypothetical protein
VECLCAPFKGCDKEFGSHKGLPLRSLSADLITYPSSFMRSVIERHSRAELTRDRASKGQNGSSNKGTRSRKCNDDNGRVVIESIQQSHRHQYHTEWHTFLSLSRYASTLAKASSSYPMVWWFFLKIWDETQITEQQTITSSFGIVTWVQTKQLKWLIFLHSESFVDLDTKKKLFFRGSMCKAFAVQKYAREEDPAEYR